MTTKTSWMSAKRTARAARLAAVLAVLLLGACEHMPQLGGLSGPRFEPLSDDISGMAPRDPLKMEPVLCAVGKGAANYGAGRQGGWRDFKTVSFALPGDGSRTTVPLTAAKGGQRAAIKGFYDEEGQKMIFCPLVEGPPDMVVDCFSLYVLGDDLDMGIKRTFDVPDAVRGGQISCAYKKENLQPL